VKTKGRTTPKSQHESNAASPARPPEFCRQAEWRRKAPPYRSSPRIGVLGPNDCDEAQCALGRAVGAGIARQGGVLLCGGLGGMMEAAAEGAKSEGGLTIGILPGENAADANRFIDIPLPTGLGPLRNMILVRACDAVIAIQGQYGTLSEIAFALRLGIPVIGLNTWQFMHDGRLDPGILVAATPDEAVNRAFTRLSTKSQC
jgi:uncharacterized protein (TIGR00725 family)